VLDERENNKMQRGISRRDEGERERERFATRLVKRAKSEEWERTFATKARMEAAKDDWCLEAMVRMKSSACSVERLLLVYRQRFNWLRL